MFNRSSLAGAALLAATAALGAPAYAADMDEQRILVRVGDLDLSSPAGRGTLDGRVSRAADRICKDNQRSSISVRLLEDRCRAQVLANARADIELAVARHQSKSRLALRADEPGVSRTRNGQSAR